MSHLRYATQLIWHRAVHVLNIFFPANDVAVYVYNHDWPVKRNKNDPKNTFDFP